MLNLIYFINFIVVVSSQEVLDIVYTFDIDFYRTFHSKRCENRTEWTLVNYDLLGVIPPNDETSKGIRALNGSCASTFSFIFTPKSVLEVTVLVRTISVYSGLQISVFDEVENVTLINYKYRRSNKDYLTGWCTISLPIDKQTKGFITLLGFSRDNEFVLIDSIHYRPGDVFVSSEEFVNDTKSFLYTKRSDVETTDVNWDKLYSEELIEEFSGSGDESSETDDDFEGSGVYEFSSEPPITTDNPNSYEPVERPPEEPIENTEFWTPLTISAVSVGSIGALTAVGFAAYYIGKFAATATSNSITNELLEDPFLIDVYQETPRIIPRARIMYSS